MSRNSFLDMSAKRHLEELNTQVDVAAIELQEARAFGDLSENTEYEIAHAKLESLLAERDACEEYLSEPILPIPSGNTVQKGSRIRISMYGPYEVSPMEGSPLEPLVFKGVLIIGGSAPFHRVIHDFVMDDASPSRTSPILLALLNKAFDVPFTWYYDKKYYLVVPSKVREDEFCGFEIV